MTTPEIENPTPITQSPEKDERKRRGLLLVLLLVLLLLCAAACLFLRYLLKPEPIADILPLPQVIQSPPTYVKMFEGVDGPTGVAVSPDAQRIYVAEGDGERLIKIFDRDGNLIKSFAPPFTEKTNRNPAYLAVAGDGRVFVSERYNNQVVIFDADGNFIDTLVGKGLSLSEFLESQGVNILPPGSIFYYDNISKFVLYQVPDGQIQHIEGPDQEGWSPLGLRFDATGNLLVTNLVSGKHSVLIIDAASLESDLQKFNPNLVEFGTEGKEAGQFSFPNSAVMDNDGNFYVSDGNNGRISAWNSDLSYRSFFAFGSSEQALNLPRGMWMDGKDHLHVADAVGQFIRVYDVSSEQPAFLFNFGEFGIGEGKFNFPVDICMDGSGRVYVADNENNRIDIWSY